MSSIDKLIDRFLSVPVDFDNTELKKVMRYYGYEECNAGKTSGSRVKFVNRDAGNDIISIHKPHPGNIVKRYVIMQIIDKLKEDGRI